MNEAILSYNKSLPEVLENICQILMEEIQRGLPGAESKIWHAHPVWFLDGNPIVGYSTYKKGIRLLFWSGQTFDEPGLAKSGSFKAAEAYYTDANEINSADVQRWLGKAEKIQWDYKNIVKHRGELVRLK